MATSTPSYTQEKLYIGCGRDQREDYVNLDLHAEVNPDVVHNIEEAPWPFQPNSFNEVMANHVLEHISPDAIPKVFAEAGRVLESGGVFRIAVPIGSAAFTDPTHKNFWTYETPKYFTKESPFSWEVDVPFRLEDREVDVELTGPLNRLNGTFNWCLEHFSEPGPWLNTWPTLSGELRVDFVRL